MQRGLVGSEMCIRDSINNHIGYFFHSPFPSGEIFKVLPSCLKCMKSLLHCDSIGFQLYEYARHFFTSCQRLLGLEAEVRRGGSLGILFQGRDVLISVRHIGISRDQTELMMKTEEFYKEIEKLEVIIKNKYVIASVEILSSLAGIKYKLSAFESILEKYPKYRQRLLLIQYCTPGSKLKFNEDVSIGNNAPCTLR
eukprot:TRINITY_DN29390_c0_g1_i1.p2 TRINITY_DN29390_c0_g1~~TRINITY_DN29390_c0_g1_i1.p2  ORF type:complete len:196 (-),score=21.25 TRINITY_DN29390_c0_g1_i1:192-779(-)